MTCIRAILRASSVAALALLALVLAASSARAEDTSPLARLSAEERAVLERRIPALETLPKEKQELLVRNVERLRSLDPRHRELMVRRMQDAREAHLGAEELDERRRSLKNLGGDKAQLAEWHGLGMRALALVAWRDLPATLREHPALKGLARHEFMQAFHRKYWGQAVESLDLAAAAAFEAPPSLPAPFRERLERVRAAHRAAPADPKASRLLRDTVLQGRAMLAVRESFAAPVTPGGDVAAREARLLRLGEVLRAIARPAYDATLASLVRLGEEKGPERLAEKLREMARPPQPPADVQRRLDAVRVVVALELLDEVFQRNPALAAEADRLLRTALVDGLGVPADEVARLPARGTEEREQALRTLAEQRFPQGRWGPRGMPGRFPGKGGPRPPGDGERAEGEKPK